MSDQFEPNRNDEQTVTDAATENDTTKVETTVETQQVEQVQTDDKQEPKQEPSQQPEAPSQQENENTQQDSTKKPIYAYKVKKQHKSFPFMQYVLTAVISLTFGLAGGAFFVSQYGTKNTVVYTSNEASTSKTTTVQNSTSSLTLAQVASNAQPSVVEILTEVQGQTRGFFSQAYTAQSAGSGVIISKDGYVITNNHVVEGATSIQVTTFDGKDYEATLIGTDSKSDIAVLKINGDDLVPATIGDSSKIMVGDTAIVIGNPLGTLGGTVTDGIISATSREIVLNNESMDLIQTNAAINSGNSGGGLFDGNGHLIGIVNAKDSGTTSSGATIEGLGFAIPVNTAMDVAKQLMENGKVTDRATLGVYLQTLQQDTSKYKAGLYITDIIHGSGAEAAGLQSYDRIISADGTTVDSYAELTKILQDKKPGDTLDLVIERDGKTINVTVTLTGVLDTTTTKTSMPIQNQ